MRNAKIALVAGSIAILIGGVLFFRTPSSVSATDAGGVAEALPLVVPPVASATLPVVSLGSSKKTDSVAEDKSAAGADLKEFENSQELANYSLLRKKVFLNEEEKVQKQNLLKDIQLIDQVKNLFKVPGEYKDLENQQNAAVDFLLEALNGENSSVASEVLKSIIQDPATENDTLTPAARENLAGIKAEVLYKWSSQDPDKAEEMPKWLPGPVSQKIWKNVLAQQAMNRAESALTK